MRLRLLAVGAALVGLGAAIVAPAAIAETHESAHSTATVATGTPNHDAGTDTIVTLPSGRTYRLFVPTHPSATPRLVIGLYGLGQNAALFERVSDLDKRAGAAGIYMAYPEGVQTSWNAGICCWTAAQQHVDDVGFLAQVIDDVAARIKARPAVAMVGFSNGGMLAYRFACQHPELVSGFEVVESTNSSGCRTASSTSILALHGLKDPLVPLLGTHRSKLSMTGSLPSEVDSVHAVATADHCPGSTRSTTAGLVTTTTYTGCPHGATVQLRTSPTMIHGWPSTPVQVTYTGMDPTAITWEWLASLWHLT